MKTNLERLAWGLALVYLATFVRAAESDQEAPAAQEPWSVRSMEGAWLPVPVEVQSGENQLIFRTGDAAQQAAQELRERLENPERRAEYRAEQRTSLEQLYSDMEQELGIDAVTKDKVMELLTDEQLMRMETSFLVQPDHEAAMQKEADFETQCLASLRELLGPEGLEKLQFYRATLGERQQVNQFDALLPATEKLQPEQKSKLVRLFSEKNKGVLEQALRSHSSTMRIGEMERLPSPEELQRRSQLLTIEGNEAMLRRAKEENPVLEKRAAQFLSPAQLAAFTRMNEEESRRLREWIEEARLQAGLSPQIPESEQSLVPRPAPRKAVTGEATFEFKVTVNRNAPVTVTHTGPNANPILFEAAEGLWVEATPTLYEDHWLDVHLQFYEQVGSEKRRLDPGSRFGTLSHRPDGTPSGGGMSTDVVTGSKGYAVKTQVAVRAP
jgi:hypothetical protein